MLLEGAARGGVFSRRFPHIERSNNSNFFYYRHFIFIFLVRYDFVLGVFFSFFLPVLLFRVAGGFYLDC